MSVGALLTSTSAAPGGTMLAWAVFQGEYLAEELGTGGQDISRLNVINTAVMLTSRLSVKVSRRLLGDSLREEDGLRESYIPAPLVERRAIHRRAYASEACGDQLSKEYNIENRTCVLDSPQYIMRRGEHATNDAR